MAFSSHALLPARAGAVQPRRATTRQVRNSAPTGACTRMVRVAPPPMATSSPLATSSDSPSATAAGVRQQKRRANEREGNVDGPYWVDETCINCDTCRWMAPHTFSKVGNGSAVVEQPRSEQERVVALQALLSCPTHSIHADERSREDLQAAQQGLPALVPGVPNVYHCGWHSEKSFGAASYLLVRPVSEGGNIMFDSPRYNGVLAKNIEALGGVSTIILSHKDDVADHAKWASHFNAKRILHELEVQASTADVEVKLQGDGPWDLDGRPLQMRRIGGAAQPPPGSQIVHTPGHSTGSICVWYEPQKAMFTGDHLSQDEREPSELRVFTRYVKDSLPRQLENIQKLLQYDWMHVLPGHGRRFHARDAAHRLEATSKVVSRRGLPANMV
uniref:Metallo-beta-lactamase domain-containing protein n=1 Tax=Chlamydomonas euryale TaxID=1486919 RepID=A0A7R9VJC2_9CHLO|mmetsp:Transcript_37139/g.109529  ORF Transcript_37139/g.109529 Transcript_37139/m.109529 type:complete len:388 (+) Transcript_37139:2350-3513(+)